MIERPVFNLGIFSSEQTDPCISVYLGNERFSIRAFRTPEGKYKYVPFLRDDERLALAGAKVLAKELFSLIGSDSEVPSLFILPPRESKAHAFGYFVYAYYLLLLSQNGIRQDSEAITMGERLISSIGDIKQEEVVRKVGVNGIKVLSLPDSNLIQKGANIIFVDDSRRKGITESAMLAALALRLREKEGMTFDQVNVHFLYFLVEGNVDSPRMSWAVRILPTSF